MMNDDHLNHTTNSRVKIWQQNLAKSNIAQQGLINTANPDDWDILAIQEPWIDHLGKTRANPKWSVVYPTCKGKDNLPPPRSVLLINTKIPSESITQIPINSNDITAIKIQTQHHTLTIINIYNMNDKNDTITILSDAWEARENEFIPTANTELILLGDFNRHHPMWEGYANEHLTSPNRLLSPLLDLIINMRLEMVLPKGIPTLEARHGGRWTRPDNVWRNSDTTSSILACEVKADLRPPVTDHLPIIITLDLKYYPTKSTTRYNFKLAKWDDFEDSIQAKVQQSLLLNYPRYDNTEVLEQAVNELFQILQETTTEHVPVTKPQPYLKRWWNKSLTRLRLLRNRASTDHFKWRGIPEHPTHAEFRRIQREYAAAIDEAKATHWKEWIEHIGESDIWKVNKYMNASPTDYSTQRIPHLNRSDGRKTATSKEKAERLAEVFFPAPTDTPDSTPPFTERAPPTTPPEPQTTFTVFTPERVIETLRNISPYKAPGHSGIPNIALKHCAETIAPVLARIYTAICKLSYYPTRFRCINQVVIRKPGRPSYEEANAYRPIALIETLAKVQSIMVTQDLSYICEKHELLPKNQFGGRPGMTTSEALHLVEQFTKNAWRKGEVVSALFLDIQAAFPNMQKVQLLENMRARKIPEGYCNYVEMILTHREIRLIFDDVTSQPCSPPGGCNQGCPLSMLLYIIYNAPLINIADPTDKNECIIGYIDDPPYWQEAKPSKKHTEQSSQ